MIGWVDGRVGECVRCGLQFVCNMYVGGCGVGVGGWVDVWLCVFVCACLCVRACVRVCVCVCVRACVRAKMEIWRNQVAGTDSHFALKRSLVVFVLWSSALATVCNKFGQNSCILVVSHPLEALRRSAFSNLAATDSWSCDTPLW